MKNLNKNIHILGIAMAAISVLAVMISINSSLMASQSSTVISNGTGSQVRAAMNNALATTSSSFSGSTAPTYTASGRPWYDTTNQQFKIWDGSEGAGGYYSSGTSTLFNLTTLGTFTANKLVSTGTETVNQLVSTGTVTANKLSIVAAPKFSAVPAIAQTISSATTATVTLGTVNFDTNSNFSGSKFTPTVQGYYLISGLIRITGTTISQAYAMIYKNGTVYQQLACQTGTAVSSLYWCQASVVVYANGSTDYFDLHTFVSGTGTLQVDTNDTRFFGTYIP